MGRENHSEKVGLVLGTSRTLRLSKSDASLLGNLPC